MAITKVTSGGITDATIATADIANGAVAETKLATDSVTTVKVAGGAITEPKLAANSINTAKIADEAVTLAKLPHGDGSSDGKFLRANNGADPSFETVTSTTINNNADNRVITGSGTANTLEGESQLTYDNSTNILKVASASSTSTDLNLFHVVGGGTATRGLMIGTGRSTGASQNHAMVYYDAINDESNEYGSQHIFRRGGHNNMVIGYQSNNYVGINNDYPNYELSVKATDSNESTIQILAGGNGKESNLLFGAPDDSDVGAIKYDHNGDHMKFLVGASERMRLNSGGLEVTDSVHGSNLNRFKATTDGHVYARGLAGGYISNTGSYHQFINTGNGQWCMQIKQEHHNGMNTQMLVNSVTNIEAFQIYSTSNSTTRFRVLNNGNCANANNSFGSLSDVKLKENIVDAKSQWNDVKAVKVRNFNFKNDKDSKLLGVVAQEVESVSSGLVFDTIDRDPNDSTKEIGTTKNVKYSILYMKAFKALQEAMARIEVLEAKVA